MICCRRFRWFLDSVALLNSFETIPSLALVLSSDNSPIARRTSNGSEDNNNEFLLVCNSREAVFSLLDVRIDILEASAWKSLRPGADLVAVAKEKIHERSRRTKSLLVRFQNIFSNKSEAILPPVNLSCFLRCKLNWIQSEIIFLRNRIYCTLCGILYISSLHSTYSCQQHVLYCMPFKQDSK